MEPVAVVRALAALAQPTRLAVFRLLVQAGDPGHSVGRVADDLGVPNTTLSFHLKELAHAGLVVTRQQGRFVFCFANFEAIDRVVGFLVRNCCAGEPCAVSTKPRCQPGRTTT